MLITANAVKKSFAENIVFENVSFGVDEHDKIGFIGTNGAGKSTLFKLLTGELYPDSGEIFKNKNIKIGYLDQYACADSEKNVLEETLEVFSELSDIETELEDIQYEIENNPQNMEKLISRQHNLMERYDKEGGFLYKNLAKSTLVGLGFSESDLKLNVSKLSGGQKTRISLAKILLSESNLLLLDEPTNHLDIQSVEWLENFLKNYAGAFIVISHDRYFLDRVTNKTFEIENGKFYSMNLPYSDFASQRDIDKLTEERNYENTLREIERLEKVVEQQRRWNREKNIKTAESKLKVIDKLKESLTEPEQLQKEANIRFQAHPGGGKDVLITEGLEMKFSDKSLFSNVDIHITKGEKLFLIGPNGCGKTTLIKIILGILKATDGNVKIGANTFTGYYDQLQESLDMSKSVMDEVWDTYPKLTQTSVRNALAAFLFKGEDVFKKVKTLSGGERARVELVKLILKNVNFLIMDEPTNHLDIQSREALEKALSEYDGTLLIVSHDRYFINSIATGILRLDSNGITVYDGNYDYYLEKYVEKEKKKEEKTLSAGGISRMEQKRVEAEKRKLKNQLANTEKKIDVIEKEIDELSLKMESPEVSVDYIKAAEIADLINEKKTELDELYLKWEDLQNKTEDI